MKPGLLVGGGALAALGVGIALLRPGPLPPPREADVLASLGRAVVAPMGDVVVVGEPSDCRSGGVAKAALPAALFRRFLDANGAGAERLELASLGLVPEPAPERLGVAPAVLAAREGKPVVAISRVGMEAARALVCVEVFGARDRAFYVLLARGHGRPWSVQRELLAWEDTPPVLPAAGGEEPLFLPRPSQLHRTKEKT